MRLQQLYQQLKVQKIQELEGLLEEQDEYVEQLNESVNKLAQHWKEEAERQVALAKQTGSAEFIAKMSRLEVRFYHASAIVSYCTATCSANA